MDRPTTGGVADDPGEVDEVGGGWPVMHIAAACLWLYLAGWVPVWSGVWPWLWAPVGLTLTAIARSAVKTRVSQPEHGQRLYERARLFTTLAAASATGWLVWAGYTLPAGFARPLGVAVLWALVFGGWYLLLRYQAPVRAEAIREQVAAAREEAEDIRARSELVELWQAWCNRVSLAVVVADVVPNTAGHTVHLDVSPDEKGQVPRYSNLTAAVPALAALASRHYAPQGKVIGLQQLRPEPTEAAHQWLVHVDTERPLKAEIPHPGDRGAGTFREPVDIGIYQDGTHIWLPLLGVHGTMVATTGGGKSVLLNNLIEAVTRCPDVELWVGTTSKLMPIVLPWLMPWLKGITSRPVIERIAGQGLDEVLVMLRDLYRYCEERNKRLGGRRGSKHVPTRDDPALMVIIDEATDVTTNKTAVVTTFDGRTWTASALIDNLVQKLRSSGGNLFLVTQKGLISALGDYGTEIMRNITLRIAGKTMKAHDGTQTLSGMDHVDTTKLRDHTLMVQPNNDVARAIPAKCYMLEDADQIERLAIANTRYRGSGLPGWLVEKMGGSYVERWLPQRQPTLVEACEEEGLEYPVAAVYRMAGKTPDPGTGGDDGTGQVCTEPSAQSEEVAPSGDLNPHTTAGTLDTMTTTPDTTTEHAADPAVSRRVNAADLSAAAIAAREAVMEIPEFGPMGKAMALVYRAFHAPDAPAQARARTLARVSGLAGEQPTAQDLDAAVARIIRDLAHYGAMPAQRTGDDDGNPLISKTAFVEAWERAKAFFVGMSGGAGIVAGDAIGPKPGDETIMDVLPAIAAYPDDAYLTLSELARLTGHMAEDGALEGDEAREAARRFSRLLREQYQLPGEAFKRTAAGNTVSVAALRASTRATR